MLGHCVRTLGKRAFLLLLVLPPLLPCLAHAQLAQLAGEADVPVKPWVYAGLPGQKAPPTRFAIQELDGKRVLNVLAERSYGNLVHPFKGQAAGVLSWRLRVDVPLLGTNLRSKQGDDAALKVCAMFDMPRENVPFLERQLLKIAESRVGEALSLPPENVLHS